MFKLLEESGYKRVRSNVVHTLQVPEGVHTGRGRGRGLRSEGGDDDGAEGRVTGQFAPPFSSDQLTIGKIGNIPPSLMMLTSPICTPWRR